MKECLRYSGISSLLFRTYLPLCHAFANSEANRYLKISLILILFSVDFARIRINHGTYFSALQTAKGHFISLQNFIWRSQLHFNCMFIWNKCMLQYPVSENFSATYFLERTWSVWTPPANLPIISFEKGFKKCKLHGIQTVAPEKG